MVRNSIFEGFEFRVLNQFFKDASTDMYPRFMIIEYNSNISERAGGDSLALLKSVGYKVYTSSSLNYIMILEG
jgi:hypothetical protein